MHQLRALSECIYANLFDRWIKYDMSDGPWDIIPPLPGVDKGLARHGNGMLLLLRY
jgi:hypothetical protein